MGLGSALVRSIGPTVAGMVGNGPALVQSIGPAVAGMVGNGPDIVGTPLRADGVGIAP